MPDTSIPSLNHPTSSINFADTRSRVQPLTASNNEFSVGSQHLPTKTPIHPQYIHSRTPQPNGWMQPDPNFPQDNIHVTENVRSKMRQADIQIAAPDIQALPTVSPCLFWAAEDDAMIGYVQRQSYGVVLNVNMGVAGNRVCLNVTWTPDLAREIAALLFAQADALDAELGTGAGDVS